MWEARAVDGRVNDLADWARRTHLPAGADGFVNGTVYVSADGGDRVVVVAHWRDAAAVEAYAGDDAGAAGLLAREPHVWLFTPLA
jgi:heme-degrading monooxygenase HmoA